MYLINGILHTMASDVIRDGFVSFEHGKITAAGRKRCRLPAKISCVSFFHHQRPVPPGFNFCKKEKISLDFLREIVIIIMRFGKKLS